MYLLEKQKRKHRSNISDNAIRFKALSVTYVTRVSFLCNRSMYHVPDVTRGTDGTCGTFAPSGTWYARGVLIKLASVLLLLPEVTQRYF